MHQKYKIFEKQVIDRLNKILHLDDFGFVKEDIYYYGERVIRNKKGKKGFLLGKIEMDLGMEE